MDNSQEKRKQDKDNREKLYRKESLDTLSSPEDLDRYIKTTKPSVWLVLIAILIFLVGVLVWSSYAKIESKETVGVGVSSGKAVFYVKEADFKRVSDKSTLKLKDNEYGIVSADGPYEVNISSDDYILHASDVKEGEWYYECVSDTDVKDGYYEGYIIFEKISPIELILPN